MRDKGGYWYKNETLIERLDITIEEQKYMKTIVSTEVKYIRNNERRREARRNKNGLTNKQQELANLKKKILKLKEEGLSNRAIGRELNISEYKVRSILKNSAMKNGSL